MVPVNFRASVLVTECAVFVENAMDLLLYAFAVDGRWLCSINSPTGRHELITTDWGVCGSVIAQFSGVYAQGQTVLFTQRFCRH